MADCSRSLAPAHMEFGALRRHWNRFGRRDPFWAALTRREGRWSPEEFYESGRKEIAAVLARAASLGIVVRRGRALDFGCGAGRLTQALAECFDRCDGVDIAPSMIAAAKRHNQHPATCHYHLNASPDLSTFDDGSFTFIYSVLVLQHMEPEVAERHMRELLRVLAPGGLLVFQLPSHRSPEEPPQDAPRSVSMQPLPASAFAAHLSVSPRFFTAAAGESLTLTVAVENRSPISWPSLARRDGTYQIEVANRWLRADGSVERSDDGRCPLPFDVAPGGRVQVLLEAGAPRQPGEYALEVDLVQEDVAWFGDRGSDTCLLAVRVAAREAPTTPAQHSDAEPDLPHAVLERVQSRRSRTGSSHGMKLAYLGARRSLHELRTAARREWLRFRRRHQGPVMEMHCVPRARVVDLVAESGATLRDIEIEQVRGGFQSCRYWVIG